MGKSNLYFIVKEAIPSLKWLDKASGFQRFRVRAETLGGTRYLRSGSMSTKVETNPLTSAGVTAPLVRRFHISTMSSAESSGRRSATPGGRTVLELRRVAMLPMATSLTGLSQRVSVVSLRPFSAALFGPFAEFRNVLIKRRHNNIHETRLSRVSGSPERP